MTQPPETDQIAIPAHHVKETLTYSVLSFPRRREPRKINVLDPRLRGDDE